MGEQELEDSLPSTSFPMFTHCSLLRTLSSCLSSSTVEAVATFHSRCGLDGSAVYQGARQLLTSDVLDAVERELQRQNELRYFSSRAMSSEEKPVTLLSSTLQADAVYASGQRVICTLPWETPFAFVWGLLLPLLSGAIVVCGPVPRQSSADCLITNASGLATAVANHPKVTQVCFAS